MKYTERQKVINSKNSFKSNFYFESYKNNAFGSIRKLKEFLKQFNLDSKLEEEVVRRIANYQIEKNGGMFESGLKIEQLDIKKIESRVRSRKKYNANARGIESRNSKIKRWTE